MKFLVAVSLLASVATPTLHAQIATLPLYRLVHGPDHFYTTSCAEKNTAVLNNGYVFEGVQSSDIFPVTGPQIVPFYRLINGTFHFYTANPAEEQQNLRDGWNSKK